MKVQCLDRTTGDAIWSTEKYFSAAGDAGGVSVGTDKLFVCVYHFTGSPFTKTVALDITNGDQIWENTEARYPRTTPALGTVNNSLGHPNIYIADRADEELIAIDSETGVTQWVADISGPVGEPGGQVGRSGSTRTTASSVLRCSETTGRRSRAAPRTRTMATAPTRCSGKAVPRASTGSATG